MSSCWTADGEWTSRARTFVLGLAVAYGLVICLLCFLPQSTYPILKGFETPGIVHFGRMVLLLQPLNSLVNAGQLDSWQDVAWIFLQNLTNLFLLTPLVFLLLLIWPKLRTWKRVAGLSLSLSLFIECTQLLLDVLIDAGRVFETDDLWTNTLGGLVAFWLYSILQKISKKRLAR